MSGNQYVVGGSGRGAILAANPIGSVIWVGAQAAFEGIGPSDQNDGRSPKTPLATVAQALTNAVSGRGDRIVLMPGTYSVTAATAITKNAIEIVSLMPRSAVISSPNTTGAAKVFTIDANDVVLDGITISCGDQVTEAVDIANTSAANRVTLHDCALLGSGAASASTGVQIGDGTNDGADVRVVNCFIDRFKFGVTWNGTRSVIEGNSIVIPSTASASGITVPTRASLAVRSFGVIRKNGFVGAENAGTKLALTFEAAEAASPMYAFYDNVLTNCGSVTANIHPEGVGANYVGTATTAAPTLIVA